MSRLNWRLLLAAGVGLAVLIVGLDLALGFLVSLALGVLGGALVYARVAGRRNPPSTGRRPRRAEAPALRAGHDVITVRDLGGPLREYVPQGTRGVIVSTSWDGITASFTIPSAFGDRQVKARVRPEDLRRI